MAYLVKFKDYVFPAGFVPVSFGGGEDIAEQPLPRRAGSYTQEGRGTSRQLLIQGSFAAETLAAWEAQKDAIMATCSGTGNLHFGRDDRYYKDAQLTNIGYSDPAEGRLYGVFGNLQLTFAAARYPEPFGTSVHSPALPATGGNINYSQGTADTFPLWTITVGAGTGTLTLNNATTGEVCLITPPAGGVWTAGTIIALNRDGNTCAINGVPTVGRFDRRIPRLAVGNNLVLLSGNGTASPTAFSVSYAPRFRS